MIINLSSDTQVSFTFLPRGHPYSTYCVRRGGGVTENRTKLYRGEGGSNKNVHTLIKKSTKFKIGAFSKVDHPLFPIM